MKRADMKIKYINGTVEVFKGVKEFTHENMGVLVKLINGNDTFIPYTSIIWIKN